ncbi:MAG: DNA-directed RNA polymerase subunit omega [Candidatus Omnitrophota bacterium]|nr:DNA-directed RNA polymerase subunit omega [Candidatus Omnitrophota bacterium]MDZ4243194.1 DNA-directed RNA polymerase subunit omega [Candidatus Omnitrophota bacterium]
MGYQPLERLLPKTGYSIYRLVRLAANRAMELADGQPKLVENVSSEKVTTIALEEIMQGKVVLKDVADKFKPEKTKKAESKPEDESADLVASEEPKA